MATGEPEACNLFMQFVVDADSERPPFFSHEVAVLSVVVVTEVLQ